MLIVDAQVHITPSGQHRQISPYRAEELPWLQGRGLKLLMGRAVCDSIGWKLPG